MSDQYPRIEAVVSTTDEYYEVADGRGSLKAVPADAIVIERGELPEVRTNGTAIYVGDLYQGSTVGADADRAARLLACARRDLALAEYLAEHPPVDPHQVNGVLHVLANATDLHGCSDGWDLPALARRLVERGVKPEPTS